MNDKRDEFRAWLTENEPSAREQALAARNVWNGHRRDRRLWIAGGVAALVAAGLTAWFLGSTKPPKPPHYDASLVVQAGGQHVRIEVGITENER